MGKRILITAPVHQTTKIFKEYLNSLNHLIIPNEYEIDKYFYLHKSPELKTLLKENEYIEIEDDAEKIEYEINGHKKWKAENFISVTNCRNAALKKAREEKYDYIFSVDSDILLHPKTLEKLLLDDKLIVGNVFFTKINNIIAPTCWEYEGYKHYENENFFYIPGLYQVGIIGGVVLIKSEIFNNLNINYTPTPGVDNTLSEDYNFCLKVHCNFPKSPIWIDTTYPSRHLYHEKDYIRWMKEKEKYE